MRTEAKLDAPELSLFDLDQQYRANPTGARFISHLAINNVLYLLARGQVLHSNIVVM